VKAHTTTATDQLIPMIRNYMITQIDDKRHLEPKQSQLYKRA